MHQNTMQTLAHKSPLIEYYDGVLKHRSGFENASFESDEWIGDRTTSLVTRTKTMTVNFSCFADNPAFSLVETTVNVLYLGTAYAVDNVTLAKILTLETLVDGTDMKYVNLTKAAISKLFYFICNLTKNKQLDKEDVQQLYEFSLMHLIDNEGTVNMRMTGLSYVSAFQCLDIGRLRQKAMAIGMPNLIPFLNHSERRERMENVVKENMDDMTWGDYISGGSFDRLTLDYGKHYIQFMREYFEENYVAASSIQKVIDETVTLLESADLPYQKNTKGYIFKILSGLSVEQLLASSSYIDKKSGNRYSNFSKNKLEDLHRLTLDCFSNHYQKKLRRKTVTDDTFCNKFLHKIAVQGIATTSVYDETVAAINQCLIEEKEGLAAKILENCGVIHISLDEYKEKLSSFTEQFVKDHKTPGIKEVLVRAKIEQAEGEYDKEVFDVLRNIKAAGVSLFLSLTGWRESEYGFAMDDFQFELNKDVTDNESHPLRIHINWFVPKTTGDVKLQREIILPAYLYAYQMNTLLTDLKPKRTLYSVTSQIKNPLSSHRVIQHSVKVLWFCFLDRFQPFLELDELDDLLQLEVTTERLNILKDKYPRNDAKVKYLREIRDRLKTESVILKSLNWSERGRDGKTGVKVFEFIKGIMPDTQLKCWEEGLLEEDKLYLMQFKGVKTAQDIPADVSSQIFARLANDCIHPTPHAFRHMWAEAVLQRYSGDVGWMIRTNFKHINGRFLDAYLRGKLDKKLKYSAERTTIRSIVFRHVLSIQNDKREFAGKFDAYISHLVRQAKITDPNTGMEVIENFADQIASGEIIGIKSNPWGYCLLRANHQVEAACAEDGVPQRHKASPEFCLGCGNNEVTEGHIAGIMLSIELEIQLLESKKLPFALTRMARDLVTDALKIVKEMRNNSGNQNLDKYIKRMDNALAKEKVDVVNQ